jgi:hypothetical protein
VREATRDGVPAIDLIDGDLLLDKLKELGLGVVVERTLRLAPDNGTAHMALQRILYQQQTASYGRPANVEAITEFAKETCYESYIQDHIPKRQDLYR